MELHLFEQYESTIDGIKEILNEYESNIKEDLLEDDEIEDALKDIEELKITLKWITKLRDSEYSSYYEEF